jgi:hypothetical protein
MSKFRKITVVIDAVQFNALGDHPAVIETSESPTGFGIFTLENTRAPFEVKLTDWIITGVAGEVYACDNEIFGRTYEPVFEACE